MGDGKVLIMPANTGGILLTGGCGTVGRLIAPVIENDDFDGGRWYCFAPIHAECGWDNTIVGNVLEVGDVFLAARGKRAIIHMAMGPLDDPQQLFEVGVRGFYNVLLVAKELGIARVVLSSSMSVFDDWADATIANEGRPPCCDDPYGVVKVLAEEVGRHFSRAYGMSVLVLRFAVPRDDIQAKRYQLGRRKVSYTTSASDLARAFCSAVIVPHTGFDIIHVTGNSDSSVINQDKAKRILKWEPTRYVPIASGLGADSSAD